MVFGWLKKWLGGEPSYWDVINPYWNKISTTSDPDTFLRDVSSMPVATRHLWAVTWLQSEVHNGGFGQFCSNSTGILAPEARDGFIAIGMPQTAAVVGEYLAFWGADYPRDCDLRNALWEKLSIERYGVDSHGEPLGGDFAALDDRFYKLMDSENGGFDNAADTYAIVSKN